MFEKIFTLSLRRQAIKAKAINEVEELTTVAEEVVGEAMRLFRNRSLCLIPTLADMPVPVTMAQVRWLARMGAKLDKIMIALKKLIAVAEEELAQALAQAKSGEKFDETTLDLIAAVKEELTQVLTLAGMGAKLDKIMIALKILIAVAEEELAQVTAQAKSGAEFDKTMSAWGELEEITEEKVKQERREAMFDKTTLALIRERKEKVEQEKLEQEKLEQERREAMFDKTTLKLIEVAKKRLTQVLTLARMGARFDKTINEVEELIAILKEELAQAEKQNNLKGGSNV